MKKEFKVILIILNLFNKPVGKEIVNEDVKEEVKQTVTASSYEIYQTEEELSKYFDIKTTDNGFFKYTYKDDGSNLITPQKSNSIFIKYKGDQESNLYENERESMLDYGVRFRDANTFDSRALININVDEEGNEWWNIEFGEANKRRAFREYNNIYGWRKDYYEKVGPFKDGAGPIFIIMNMPNININNITINATLIGRDYYDPDNIEHIIKVTNILSTDLIEGNWTANVSGTLYYNGEKIFKLKDYENGLKVYETVDWSTFQQADYMIVSTFLIDNVVPFDGNNWVEIINTLEARLNEFGRTGASSGTLSVVDYDPNKRDNTKWFVTYTEYHKKNVY